MMLPDAFKKNWSTLYTKHKPVLLAVSGGLDSMAMAHLFLDAGIAFAVAHCNFGLRGEESIGDEAFVRNWCTERGITHFIQQFDTQETVERMGTGIQETARNLRYQWFNELCDRHDFGAICTAHHADDNAETMLINLFRGTGIAGLHGIPERNGTVLRPLLFTARPELAAYVAARQISFREDRSNNSDDYLRNAIRHHILPQIETRLPGVAQRMRDTGKRIGEAEIIYKKAIEVERKKLLEQRGKDYYVPIKLLKNRVPLQTICYELFHPFGFTAQQIPFLVDDLLQAESGRFLLSPTHQLIKNRDFLIVTSLQQAATDLVVVDDFTQEINTANARFTFEELAQMPTEWPADPTIAFIDAAQLQQPLLLRRWKTGDYFYPIGMGMKKKKISRFLIDQKVPIHEKENVWVLESNKRIVWVAGRRLDERFKVKPSSKKAIRVHQAPKD